MKKIILNLSILLFSFSAIASTTARSVKSDKIFTQLKAKHNESFSMSFSKNMINFFDMDIDFNGKEKLINGDFHRGNMMVFKEVSSVQSFLNEFERVDYELIKSENIEVNTDDDEDSSEAYLYVNRKGNKVSEAHFIIAGEESITVFSVFGDITVKNK